MKTTVAVLILKARLRLTVCGYPKGLTMLKLGLAVQLISHNNYIMTKGDNS